MNSIVQDTKQLSCNRVIPQPTKDLVEVRIIPTSKGVAAIRVTFQFNHKNHLKITINLFMSTTNSHLHRMR
jgi:hypothetical protein